MNWMRWTKKQLRFYMSRDLYRQDIQNELSSMDEDIGPRISRLDGMPRGSGGMPFSSVEYAAENREAAQGRLLQQLKGINAQIERIESAIDTLSNDERSALELAYMRTSLDTDRDIANQFKMPLTDFWKLKIGALYKVYVRLTDSPHTVNLQECVRREEAKHKRSLKLREEDRAEKMEKRKRPFSEVIENKWTPEAIEKRLALLKKLDQKIDAMKRMKTTS